MPTPPATTTDVRERWGESIRIARITIRDSQHDAAVATGLTAPTVSRAEQGQGSVEIYDRLARHYGLTLTLGATAA